MERFDYLGVDNHYKIHFFRSRREHSILKSNESRLFDAVMNPPKYGFKPLLMNFDKIKKDLKVSIKRAKRVKKN